MKRKHSAQKIVRCICLGTLLLTARVAAQDILSCTVVKDYGDGSYLVQIGSKTLLAITQEKERQILKLRRDLLDLQKEMTLKDSLSATYDRTLTWYDTTLTHQKEYIAGLENVLTGYKTLLRDYKKLRQPWLTFETGIGATGNAKPALLLGFGIRQVRLLGFLQEDNAGGFLGASWRLF